MQKWKLPFLPTAEEITIMHSFKSLGANKINALEVTSNKLRTLFFGPGYKCSRAGCGPGALSCTRWPTSTKPIYFSYKQLSEVLHSSWRCQIQTNILLTEPMQQPGHCTQIQPYSTLVPKAINRTGTSPYRGTDNLLVLHVKVKMSYHHAGDKGERSIAPSLPRH